MAEVLELVLARLVRELLERVQQRLRPEHEDLVGHQVPGRLVRLVGVVDHLAVAHRDDAVTVGVVGVDLGGDDRHRRVAGHVLLDQRPVVLRVDGVGAHHHQRLRPVLADQRRVAPQRVGGALLEAAAIAVVEPRLQDQQAADRPVEVPRAAVRQMVGQRDRVELLRDPDVRQPGVVAVAEREVDQPVRAGVRHRRLGALAREQLEAAAGAAGEHDDQRPGPGHARGPTRRAPEGAPSGRRGTCGRAAPRSSRACWPARAACRPPATARRLRCR